METDGISFLKKITSISFYWVFNKLSDIKIEPGSSDFRLMDRKVAEAINNLTEKGRFFRGLVSWVGFTTTSVEYIAQERKFGNSSYTLKKMLLLAHEGLTSFSMKPLKVIFIIGILIIFLSGSFFSFMLFYKYFIDYSFFTGPAVLAMFIILNNGVLITLIGVLANYQIRMHQEIQNRPNFIISEHN
jgi:dolichol-phosphate mannosyltransferase